MLSEELILHFAWKLYSKYTIREKAIIRVTRHADIDESGVYDEDLDYRDVMEHLIKKRNKLSPVRVELSRKINDKAKAELSNYLEIGTDLSFMTANQEMGAERFFWQKRAKMPISELRLIH